MCVCVCVCVCAHARSVMSSLCNPMDGCPLDFSIHGISQTRILEQVAISYSRGSSQARDWTHVSCISCIGRGRHILHHQCHLGSPCNMLLLFSCSVMLTLCDPLDCSLPGFPVLHHLLEFAQTHVHWVGDVIQPSHPLSSPSPPALKLS